MCYNKPVLYWPAINQVTLNSCFSYNRMMSLFGKSGKKNKGRSISNRACQKLFNFATNVFNFNFCKSYFKINWQSINLDPSKTIYFVLRGVFGIGMSWAWSSDSHRDLRRFTWRRLKEVIKTLLSSLKINFQNFNRMRLELVLLTAKK